MKNEIEKTKVIKTEKPEMPRITGAYRTRSIQVPEEIYQASGIVINGRRIKSVIFSTDIAIIRNCNADAVLAVYPFTPQQVISHTIITAASMPVFCGICLLYTSLSHICSVLKSSIRFISVRIC